MVSDALVFLELWFLQGVCCLETLVSGEPELLVFDVLATLLVGSGDFRHSVVWRFGWVAVSSRLVQTSLYLAAWFLCVSTLIDRNYRSQCQWSWTPWNIRCNKFMSWESRNSERTSILSITTKVLENKHRCISHTYNGQMQQIHSPAVTEPQYFTKSLKMSTSVSLIMLMDMNSLVQLKQHSFLNIKFCCRFVI